METIRPEVTCGCFACDQVVLDSTSSLDDPHEYAETIDANHRNMVRFSDANDFGYRKVLGELKNMVETICIQHNRTINCTNREGLKVAIQKRVKVHPYSFPAK